MRWRRRPRPVTQPWERQWIADNTGGLLWLTPSGDLIAKCVLDRALAELDASLSGMCGLSAHLLRAGNDPRVVLAMLERGGYGEPAAVLRKLLR